MSEIKELIERLCPDGVEYKKLGEVAKRLRGTPITATTMKKIATEEGEIKVFAGGKTVINAHLKDIPNANIITVPSVLCQSRGVIDFIYYDKPFTFKNEMWAYTLDNNVSVKYIYYVLKQNVMYFRDKATAMGAFPQISIPDTEKFEIPVPPIEVQRKIVEILDNFTELEAELEMKLEAELEARRKQYEYYRNQLLTFDDTRSDVKWMTLGDVCEIKGRIGFRGYTIKDQVEKGEGALTFTASNIVKQHIDYNKNTYITWEKYYESPEIMVKNGDILVCQRGSIGKIALVENLNEEATINPQLLLLKNIHCNNKYLAHYLTSRHFQKALSKIVGHGTVQMIAQKDLKNLLIPIIPETEQQRNANVLDRFEALTTDLQSGLPAEIEARRKQYEYYREKLLTFKRKTA